MLFLIIIPFIYQNVNSKNTFLLAETETLYLLGNELEYPSYTYYKYDNDKKLIKTYHKSFYKYLEKWDTTSIVHYLYDKQERLTEIRSEGYEYEDYWSKKWKKTFNYDTNGWSKITTKKTYITNFELQNKTRMFEKFDENGNLLQERYQVWNDEENKLINRNQTINKYNDKGEKIESLIQNWNNKDNKWKNNYKFIYIRDSIGRKKRFIGLEWEGNKWDTLSNDHHFYKYDDNNRLIEHSWGEKNDDSISYLGKIEYDYSDNNNSVTKTKYYSFAHTSEWYPTEEYIYIYDEYDNLIEEKRKEYAGGNWSIDYYYKYKYKKFTSVNEISLNNKKMELIPNPANNYLDIAFNDKLYGNLDIKIIDITGRIVLKKNFEYKPEIIVDIKNLNTGIYYIYIKSREKILFDKFLKK